MVESLLAYAKLTRSLRIVGRRDDGYHLLDAEMVTIDLADELVFSEGEGLEVRDEIGWRGSGVVESSPVPLGPENLVVRALAISGRPARVRLTKHIPPGGGLGGGSADAAAVLRFRGITDPLVAAALGSDVPFCLVGGRARVSGVGEHLEPVDFEDRTLVVVTPAFSVSTPKAYAAYDELERTGQIRRGLVNDLEPAALTIEPRLEPLRRIIEGVVGEPPLLAGSGSSYFVEMTPGRATTVAQELRDALWGCAFRVVVTVATTTGSSPV